ncbi:MAG: FixH family protein [Reichenbachiella sp.]
MKKLLMILSLSAVIAACESDDSEILPDPNEVLVELTSAIIPDTDLSIVVYLPEGVSMEVGYNNFSLALMDGDGNYKSEAHMTVTPIMTMMEMSHSAPVENHEHDHSTGKYQDFGVVFVMATQEMGSWSLEVSVMDESFTGTVHIPVEVDSPELSKMKSIDAGEFGSLFISMVNPTEPKVGINEFEITVHERESMMSWPAITNYTIEIEPEMPAMGHGSPNNVNPVHHAMGHYMGEVNFTMTGAWLINVTIKDGATIVAETAFEIEF